MRVVEVVQQQQWSMVVQLSSVGTADCGEVVLTSTLGLSGGCRSSGEVNLVASGPLLTMSSLLTPARAPSPQSQSHQFHPLPESLRRESRRASARTT